jgi:hypothetical protein
MTFTLDDIKRAIQDNVTGNTVTIVGAGISAAAGLPTMPELASTLIAALPLNPALADDWKPIADRLGRMDLESALDSVHADSPLLTEIIQTVAKEVIVREREVICGMATGNIKLPCTALIDRLRRVNRRAVIITTNYDRLLEAAVEHAGLSIDTSFIGDYFGRFDHKQSKQTFQSLPRLRSRHVATVTRPHVVIYKPHGSLDWYYVDDAPVRSLIELDVPRLIITPGKSKHERGYEQPFDHHRAAGNTAIDDASSLFILGHGFNDGHLQTHLGPKLQAGTPAVVLTRTLSDNARSQVATAPEVIALERTPGTPNGDASTTAHWHGESVPLDGVDLWDLDTLIKEALP